MVVSIVFFTELLRAVLTLVRLVLLVHLKNVLLDVRLLAKSLPAVGIRASKRPLFCVRAHVVHELRGVWHDAVASMPELALEQSGEVHIAFKAFKQEDDEVLRVGNRVATLG